MKRILSLSLVLITLIAILVGCGTANGVYRRTNTGDRPVIDRATDYGRTGYPVPGGFRAGRNPAGTDHAGRGYHNTHAPHHDRANNAAGTDRFDDAERGRVSGHEAETGIGGLPTTVPGLSAVTPAAPPNNNEAKREKSKAPQAQNPANPNGGTGQRPSAPTPPAA